MSCLQSAGWYPKISADAELSQIKSALTDPIAPQELKAAREAASEEAAEVVLEPMTQAGTPPHQPWSLEDELAFRDAPMQGASDAQSDRAAADATPADQPVAKDIPADPPQTYAPQADDDDYESWAEAEEGVTTPTSDSVEGTENESPNAMDADGSSDAASPKPLSLREIVEAEVKQHLEGVPEATLPEEAEQEPQADVSKEAEAGSPEASDAADEASLMQDAAQAENDPETAAQDQAQTETPADAAEAASAPATEGADAPDDATTAEQANVVPMRDGNTDFSGNSLTAKIAALETAIGNISDSWEPDTSGEDAFSAPEPLATAWQDDVERDATGAQVPQEQRPQKQAAQDQVDAVEVLPSEVTETMEMGQTGAATAALGALYFAAKRPAGDTVAAQQVAPQAPVENIGPATAQTAQATAAEAVSQPEPLVPETPVAAAPAAAKSEGPTPEQVSDTILLNNPILPETATAPQAEAAPAQAPVIDEEMLRDMVSDIVRAELQGALGERITRNVRKLVRREIHRALTAQELE